MNTLSNGLTVTEETTTPTRPGKKPRPVWVVGGRTAGLEQSLLDMGGRKYRGAYSFFADPTAELEALTEDDRLTFAERQERERERAADRAERFAGYAENAAARSGAAYERSNAISRRFEFGQPILVGHHSEKSARCDQARMHNAMRKSIDESEKSEYWQERATTAEKKAEGKHSAAFCDRRVKDAETELRAVVREMAQAAARGSSAEYQGRLADRKAEWEEKKTYWEVEREAAGGVAFSKENVKVGDAVLHWGAWKKVVRVNPTTVSLETGYTWTDKCKYSEIKSHKAAADLTTG